MDFGTTTGDTLTVYTTRPDTLFGATYMVISPEHPLIEKWADKLENLDAVRAYQQEAAHKSDFERTEMNKDKTGVRLQGVMGINPVNDTEIPIFISDYVLTSYGTGAIMAVRLTIPATGNLPRSLTCPLLKWLQAAMWRKRRSPTVPPAPWSTPTSSTA